MRNAIILAAGKSSRFAPFTYEKPKGLFRVKGEVLIERQIEQKYGVKLIVNNEFGKKGNLYSMYVVRDYLLNTFICCADHYYLLNPFLERNEENRSYRACSYQEGKFREFAVQCSDADVITDVEIGGTDSLAMVGYAYFNDSKHSFMSTRQKETLHFCRADSCLI